MGCRWVWVCRLYSHKIWYHGLFSARKASTSIISFPLTRPIDSRSHVDFPKP